MSEEKNNGAPAAGGNTMFAVKLFVIAGVVLAALWWVDKMAR